MIDHLQYSFNLLSKLRSTAEEVALTDDYGAQDDKGDNDLQGGCQELFLALGRVVWGLKFGEGEGRDEYRPDTHLNNRLVDT